jgi:hypothetical protein
MTIDHHPSLSDVKRIEVEKDCRVVSAAPYENQKTKKAEYVITFVKNDKPKIGKAKKNEGQPTLF